MEWTRDGYVISDDPARLDVDAIWAFLRESYWSPGVARETVAAAIDGSLVIGLYGPAGEQAGFARAVTDRATFAYLADVYVLEQYRGNGLGVWLVQTLLDHPGLSGLRLMMLRTADAHDLYRRFGFEIAEGDSLMSRRG